MIKNTIILRLVLAVTVFFNCSGLDTYTDDFISPNIYTVNVDGTGELQITTGDRGDRNSPHFVDNGNKIVYWGHDENYRLSIFIMDNNGDNERKIASGQNIAVSHNGQWIIYESSTNNVDDISSNSAQNLFITNLDGSSITQLTEAISTETIQERFWNASFSYDDQYVVYNYERRINLEVEELAVYMMMVDGTNKKKLWPISSILGFGQFTPDGSKVVILMGGWENQKFGIYDLASETMTEITPVYETESFDISPNGERIVYETRSGFYSEIFTINFDGSEKTRLTENSLGDNIEPVFSPDGSKIAFVAKEDNLDYSNKIAVISSDGTGLSYLTNNDTRSDVHPSFSPDGNVIIFNNTW